VCEDGGEEKEAGYVVSFVACKVLPVTAGTLTARSTSPFIFSSFLLLGENYFLLVFCPCCLPSSGSNINMFRCKVNKTVFRMDIGGCFRHLTWKPHFIVTKFLESGSVLK
jgi:hypothetical protein